MCVCHLDGQQGGAYGQPQQDYGQPQHVYGWRASQATLHFFAAFHHSLLTTHTADRNGTSAPQRLCGPKNPHQATIKVSKLSNVSNGHAPESAFQSKRCKSYFQQW